MTLKSAEELFDKYKSDIMDCGYDCLDLDELKDILTEHDNELITAIEKMIEEHKLLNKIFDTDEAWIAKIHNEEVTTPVTIALTEVINLIKND
jgi:hypothetical protein